MTDNNEIKYLDMELMEKMCHKLAVAVFDTHEDPIAKFKEHDAEKLDAALSLPKHDSGYPTLNDKWLTVSNSALYEKTLYVAKSDRTEKDEILVEIKEWIKKNLVTREHMENL